MHKITHDVSLGPEFDWQMNDDGAKFGHDYLTAFQNAANYRSFGVTKRGYMAMVPAVSVRGDRIAIFCGGNVPFVTREASHEPAEYKLIGEAYVHGIMDGEVFKETEPKIETICLV